MLLFLLLLLCCCKLVARQVSLDNVETQLLSDQAWDAPGMIHPICHSALHEDTYDF